MLLTSVHVSAALQETHIVVTVLQRLKLLRESAKMPVQKGRQKTAFPPNYIHSLDSSHMMLTALACKRKGAFHMLFHLSWCFLDESRGNRVRLQMCVLPMLETFWVADNVLA